jgi:hypothetical protein
MRAMWGFKDKSILGMARPGFNAVQLKRLAFLSTYRNAGAPVIA